MSYAGDNGYLIDIQEKAAGARSSIMVAITVDKTSVDQILKRRCVKHENDHIKYFYDS